jgi:hypothetical protein
MQTYITIEQKQSTLANLRLLSKKSVLLNYRGIKPWVQKDQKCSWCFPSDCDNRRKAEAAGSEHASIKLVATASHSQARICRHSFRLTFSKKMNDQDAQRMPDESCREDQLRTRCCEQDIKCVVMLLGDAKWAENFLKILMTDLICLRPIRVSTAPKLS